MTRTLDPLIGREHELGTVSAILAARQPAFVVISGAVRMGKSALLDAMRERARDNGWFVIPGDYEALEIHEGISVASMQGVLGDLLADLNRGTDANPFTASAQTDGAAQSPPAVVTSLLAGARLTSAAETFPGAGGLLDALRRAAPVMIAVDVRMSDRILRSWLTGSLWPTVRDAGIAVVIVTIVVDKDDEQALARAATDVVRLGPLEEEAVRSYLETVTSGLPAEELDAYAEAISHDPGLLISFSRLLPLVDTPATSSPSAPNGGGSHR